MSKQVIPGGVVHPLSEDLEGLLVEDPQVLERWEDITPLARNEWICWIEDAKQLETRRRRLQRLSENLKAGKRRPCCWPGCKHRLRNGSTQ